MWLTAGTTSCASSTATALQDYSAAIQLNPRHCRAFYNRAFSNDRLRRYDAAVADYTRALEIQPGNATAYHNRASLFERLGRCVLLKHPRKPTSLGSPGRAEDAALCCTEAANLVQA